MFPSHDHWGGYPLDLDRIKKIQERASSQYGFRPALIEDCAHAFGSEYKGKKLGNHGNIVMYSLQAIKHITAVDGGILCLPYQKLFDRAKLLRWYGINREDNRKDFRCEADIEEWGFKFHMNDVNATIGIENLKHADDIISKHRSNAEFYDKNLKDVPGVTLLERHPDHNSAFWIYSMLVDNRDGFYKWMKECNITVSQSRSSAVTHHPTGIETTLFMVLSKFGKKDLYSLTQVCLSFLSCTCETVILHSFIHL